MSALQDRVLGGLLGAALGDALGGPVEGLHHAEITRRHGRVTGPMPYDRDIADHGPFTLSAGSWTDDTRMSLLHVDAVLASGGDVTAGDLGAVLVGAHAAASSALERGFLEEYALAALHRERKLVFGGHPTNGAVMGNVALGLLHPCDPAAAFATAYELAFLTDGYAKESAAVAAACVAAALRPGARPREVVDEALEVALAWRREGPLWQRTVATREWARFEGLPNHLLVRGALEVLDAHGGDLVAATPALYERLLVSPLGSEAGQTLAVALAAWVAADGDPRETVLGAVAYGRDCDSYAAVAGGIVGAQHGASALPQDWVAVVLTANDGDGLLRRAADLAALVERRHAARGRVHAGVEALRAGPSPTGPPS